MFLFRIGTTLVSSMFVFSLQKYAMKKLLNCLVNYLFGKNVGWKKYLRNHFTFSFFLPSNNAPGILIEMHEAPFFE